MFPKKPIKCDKIYPLRRKITCNRYLRCFQYKILTNILYLNNKLYTSKLANSQLCHVHYRSFTIAIQLANFGHNLNYFWSHI